MLNWMRVALGQPPASSAEALDYSAHESEASGEGARLQKTGLGYQRKESGLLENPALLV